MGKMLGGEEEKDPDAEKKEEERQEALRQQEDERKAKYAKMEAEREGVRQGIRDKAVPTGCGDEEEEEESIVDTVMKFLPGPLMDMFNKK
ncbi:hypothetical protein CRUP_002917 [Coryphaenoides rupestris]|nr:hypothetical protein CRUP_002917 [Coryphaenoides rupestris]